MKKQTTEIVTRNPSDGVINVWVEDAFYKMRKDDWAGGWCVLSDDDEEVLEDWMKDKASAFNYIMEKAEVLENANYTRDQDKTSA